MNVNKLTCDGHPLRSSLMGCLHGTHGIVANVVGVDRIARLGSKAWLVDGTGGQGWYRFKWLCRTRSGKLIVKWIPTKRMSNFRCAWIPDHVREAANGCLYISGSREDMIKTASRMSNFLADQLGGMKLVGKYAGSNLQRERT